MDPAICYLNERDRRNQDLDNTEQFLVGGYFSYLNKPTKDGFVFIHQLNELLLNENITNAAKLTDLTIQNLSSNISGDFEEEPLLIHNIKRIKNLKNVNFDSYDNNLRTLYFIES